MLEGRKEGMKEGNKKEEKILFSKKNWNGRRNEGRMVEEGRNSRRS